MEIREYPRREGTDFAAEQIYLAARVEQIEKNLGRVAAKLAPGELSQSLDALDRARELANQMYKQVRVRPLEAAVAAQKDWLARAATNLAEADGKGEPRLDFNRVELDLRILDEILAGWQSQAN